MINRRRIRRMQAASVRPSAEIAKPWINEATGRLKKGWRYPGGGADPVRVN